jgi:hypothetical protein
MTTIMEATVAKHSNLQMAENDKLMQTLQTLESEILQVKVRSTHILLCSSANSHPSLFS